MAASAGKTLQMTPTIEPLGWIIIGIALVVVLITMLLILLTEKRARQHMEKHLPFSVAISICNPTQPAILHDAEVEKQSEEAK